MENSEYQSAISQHIARNCKSIRVKAGMSLAQLADKSGVSKSALSLIERAESSPTAVILDRVAAALGTTIGGLVEAASTSVDEADIQPFTTLDSQSVWVDPSSGYSRRMLSPRLHGPTAPRTELVEVHFPPRQRVALESTQRAAPLSQQIWLLAGQLHVSEGGRTYHLTPGDCLAMHVKEPVVFYNPGAHPARYLIAIELS